MIILTGMNALLSELMLYLGKALILGVIALCGIYAGIGIKKAFNKKKALKVQAETEPKTIKENGDAEE